jgi:CRP/FNR family cyclic AMP-dependent transcriptional regulator
MDSPAGDGLECEMQAIADLKLWQILAYSGIALTVVQMWMKTMIPLRVLAISTNVLFLAYASLEAVWVTVVLNCILLPLNLYRLQEMRNLIRKVDRARGSEIDMTWLRPFMSHRHINTGEVLFRKGDVAEAMYLVDSGHFVLSETGMEVPPGTVVGELGMLSPDGRRTQTLVCRAAGEVQSLSYDRFEELYFQNPEFGLSFLKLTSRRLFQNIARLEQELAVRNSPSLVPPI